MTQLKVAFGGQELLFCEAGIKLFYLHYPYWRLQCSNSGYYLRCTKKTLKDSLFTRMLLTPAATLMVDHISGDTLDNRVSNLRVATRSQNAMNSRPRTQLPKGVSWDKVGKRFRAKIQLDGEQLNLGSFDSIEKAEQAYLRAAAIMFREFASHVSRSKT
jgi:hypothetical protein